MQEQWRILSPIMEPETLRNLLSFEISRSVENLAEKTTTRTEDVLAAAIISEVLVGEFADREPSFVELSGGPEGLRLTEGIRNSGLWGPKLEYYSALPTSTGKPLLLPLMDVNLDEILFSTVFPPVFLFYCHVVAKHDLLRIAPQESVQESVSM